MIVLLPIVTPINARLMTVTRINPRILDPMTPASAPNSDRAWKYTRIPAAVARATTPANESVSFVA